ncbi:transcriptional regulator Myc-B [Amyelois transitella]|uniref:transcriptional regulator Myc-B n=1 Tax=Amyelois transitella TaxID=680683 RepID=UPI00067B6BD2|nr:transcriptional regulator Myc-B [Amyelois transitella]XP_013196896.1 transcriptional regulator Myc-B [Amyelois transitella]
MAALIEPPSLQFDIWDQMDSATMELALTSEFWSQVQTEVDTLDILPPPDMPDITPTEIDRDWSIIDILEEPAKENIVHHDCMWAGLCDDSVHPGNTFVPTEHITASPGQSLLRNSTQSPPRPETPPSLDGDEHPPFRHAVDVAVTARKLLRDVVADHSYTLARQNCDGLGVQTPSDSCESSEEEIDVVSLEACQQTLGAPQHMRSNSLPRAPSAQERQMFQRTVASAITTRSRPVARKRLVPPTNIATGGVRKRRGPGRRGRKSNTDTESEGDCPETERRSIHNDMERLRRIGLKNLFDELKQQVPATRDKERAPKVVILREAAALCRRLRAEELQRSTLMKEQVKLMAKLKKLRAQSARHRLQ